MHFPTAQPNTLYPHGGGMPAACGRVLRAWGVGLGLALGAAAPVFAQGNSAAPATPSSSGMCSALCSTDKKQCVAQVGRVDVPAAAGTAAMLGMIFGQAAQHQVQLHEGHDTASAISTRQRRDAETKLVQREQADQCNTQYLQCLGACRSPTPAVPSLPAAPGVP